ncbi:putative disease resistance protein RGA4 isoform X2 [Ananas comosus]|uniref:Disease resistance protein RGA4 isoform X2 n=1 Tax=Ananas comosus TaxID=4615 RepID=A0A6P5G0S7_ANACO|nr:putative disease resistance protein RGA4 isoform X2 [Ananas comosus]
MDLAFIEQSLASAIIQNLVDTGLSCLKAYHGRRGMKDELERVQQALPQIQSVLIAVEGPPVSAEPDKALEPWLWQLRDVVEKAEDVLDELEYYKLKTTIEARDGEVGGIIQKCKRKFSDIVQIFSDDTLKRLREAVKGLDSFVASMEPLLQLVIGLHGHSVKHQMLEGIRNARETSSLLTESEVLGRDKERNLIVTWLTKPAPSGDQSVAITANVSAFTIVGIGGLGKTTLAQLIYRDQEVQQFFNPIIWVCVSQSFDAAVLTRKMLDTITKENLGDKSLNALHEILKGKLSSKRFLVILDDVWNDEERTEWEKLIAPLKFGRSGSKILLTTRMDSVADMAAKVMECQKESLYLTGLEEHDYMLLFNKHAFFGLNPNDYRNLQLIGEQIAKKLGGCPLLAKVMGGLLNSCMDDDHWKRISKEDILNLQQSKDNIMTVLRFSYHHLPANLQLCFRYCSIFSQDYEFTKDELVHVWIGSGLIRQSTDGKRRPEDIGSEYLNLLTRKSFFDRRSRDNFGECFEYYTMHDLLHDLARHVSHGECLRIKGDVSENFIPKTVRYLSIKAVNHLAIQKISHLQNLRTLFISIKEDHEPYPDHALVLNEFLKGFKSLRLLSISTNRLFKLRDAFSSLIHLRYLSLYQDKSFSEDLLEWFPRSAYQLYHLEVMKFSAPFPETFEEIEFDGISNLVNLRRLEIPREMMTNIPSIGKLSSMLKLDYFYVREESGYKIGELKDLKDLRRLRVRDLQNVSSFEEAIEARLNEKECLNSLSLEWSIDQSCTPEADEQLLDSLSPHSNLKNLKVKGYKGVKSPYWMANVSFSNLTSVKLIKCGRWEHLPPLGQLPSLNYLKLCGLQELKQVTAAFYGSSIVCTFPTLKELIFQNMPNWEEWVGTENRCMFPKLHKMVIRRCPNLRALPNLSAIVTRCDVVNAEAATSSSAEHQNRKNNNHEQFQALEDLTITECESLTDLPTKWFERLESLKTLNISKCSNLITHRISNTQLSRSTLCKLTIGSCGNLEMLLFQALSNSTSLTELNLNGCASITSLPAEQECARLTSLSHLEIWNCKELTSLGGIQALSSLRVLKIGGCDKLVAGSSSYPRSATNFNQKEPAVSSFLKLGTVVIDHRALLLMEPLRSLTFVVSLTFLDTCELTSLPEQWLLQNRNHLRHLEIYNAASLQSLPQSMQNLRSLRDLVAYDAFLIQSLPELPPSLSSLEITNCHPALKQRCRKHTGVDWPKIANIPDVTIF